MKYSKRVNNCEDMVKKRMNIMLEPEQITKLTKISKQNGRSKSNMIGWLIESYGKTPEDVHTKHIHKWLDEIKKD